MAPGTEAQRSPTPGQRLIETQSDEISASRVWLRRSPVGYVCMGLGPSARLARFAFEDVAPEHPFYNACRRHDRDIAREGLAKAHRLGLDIPFGAVGDPALRRLAIASALLKGGFNPAEDRDHDGKWTDGGDSGGPSAGVAARVSPEFLPKPSSSSLMGPIPPETLAALGILAARAVGIVTVFRTLFIPSNRMLVTTGTLPDHPDVKFTYDDETGLLTIHRDGADGGSYGFSGRVGEDGVFRDDQGRAVARRLADGSIIIDPDALAGPKADTANSDNQPKLCPDPGPDRRNLLDENGNLDKSKVDRAAEYQAQISSIVNPGKSLPIGLAVELPNPLGGKPVSFDDCRQSDGTMIEAKGPGYLDMLLRSTEYPWKGAEDDMVWQARRQLMAAGGRAVEWYFAEDVVAEYMRHVFEKEGLASIVIKVVPPPP
jgi:hypothetical protein